MRHGIAALVLCLAGSACSGGGTDDGHAGPPDAFLSVGEIASTRLGAGDSTVVSIPVRIAPGYHVQANPAANEFYIPLELEIEASEGLVLGTPAYPESHPHRLEGSSEELLTYEGNLSLAVPVRAPVSGAPGERRVRGNLRYQACDSRRCYFPSSVAVTFSVVVTG